ncbi:Serine/threonine-protein kinase PknL [Novipirellula aureliae]|uniref:Serine/threonine-protein kinase PknL n=1 Tax=Novipirellula aureliae TaxID=2527966 RepID=A0A5C6EAL8_9BACT|nr:Hsp70 family protein [Novipirellula aureliae]TWU45534.1 Serine/threonine-protein kinase PknL [Novipirellula aureliae]
MSDSSSSTNGPLTEPPTCVGDLASGTASRLSQSGDFSADFSSDGHGGVEGMTELEERHIPSRLGGYEIKQLIGSGGMGQVYLAEHLRMQRTVAMKTLPLKMVKDEHAINRFYEEVRAASRVLHPNIVTAFDAGEDNGFHFLAMEYIDGMTLTQIVARRGPMPVGQAASVIRQAAMGLLFAHRAGIVHRDVKPGNLMRSIDGTVKVLDLGLARISNIDLTLHPDNPSEAEPIKRDKGRLVGTLPFMSPEQLEDPDSADPRSDIYSLGATMFFLLTGQPPFTGEYLDQVYGHRHGEIPDLMQFCGDVDFQFANLFRRMMAKSPDERYASLDEVIEDLGEYADKSDEPIWLTEFASRQSAGDSSTFAGGSTSQQVANVLSIDLGMFLSSAAEASPLGRIHLLNAGGEGRKLFRMAIASEHGELLYGEDAMQLRTRANKKLVHCVPMYIGRPTVDREVAGRRCPPEVLLALMIRKIIRNAWSHNGPPTAVALTIPSSYDQLHRRSILQAASMAGLHSVRLVDRSVAAVQSLIFEPRLETLLESPGDPNGELLPLEPAAESEANRSREAADRTTNTTTANTNQVDDRSKLRHASEEKILFIGLTGQASETALFVRDVNRIRQVATAGHWHTGTLPWQQKLVEVTAELFMAAAGIDPRRSDQAPMLQVACENAMNALLILPSAKVTLFLAGMKRTVTIRRAQWLEKCTGLLEGLRSSLMTACHDANVSRAQIDTVIMLGPLLRIREIQHDLLQGFRGDVSIQAVDRSDVARGAASCLAGELPGRGGNASPPQAVAGQTIGILVEDGKRRRKVLPILPCGTPYPARTNRRLNVNHERKMMSISLVESSGVSRGDWQSLGRYDLEISNDSSTGVNRSRTIGFEININGLLVVRAQKSRMPGSEKLQTLPKATLSDEQVAEWTRWIDRFD